MAAQIGQRVGESEGVEFATAFKYVLADVGYRLRESEVGEIIGGNESTVSNGVHSCRHDEFCDCVFSRSFLIKIPNNRLALNFQKT